MKETDAKLLAMLLMNTHHDNSLLKVLHIIEYTPSRDMTQFFLILGQKNFGNKIPK